MSLSGQKLCVSKEKIQAVFHSALPILIVVGIGLFLRLYGLTEWSLWEDEERTLYFSRHLEAPFPGSFPLFFNLLSMLSSFSDMSLSIGRYCAATAGIAGVCFFYACFYKRIGRTPALLSTFFIAVNFGHLFWSQSIRYYSTVFLFQLVCIYLFLKGFEEEDLFALVLSNMLLALALATHSSAILIVPVFAGFIILTVCLKGVLGGYGLRYYLVYGMSLVAVMVGFVAWKSTAIHGMVTGWTVPSARDPFHILLSVVFFFGVPLVVFGFIAPFVSSVISGRMTVFFTLLSFLPPLELVTIAMMDTMDVAWYHVLFSLMGFAVLASVAAVSLYGSKYRMLSLVLLAGTFIYYLVFAVSYHTTLNGCRPPWQEVAEYLRKNADIDPGRENNPEIYATAPAVVAYYLGAEPGARMGSALVERVGFNAPEQAPDKEQWFLMRPNYVNETYARWLKKNCRYMEKFESRIGPVDRWSVIVYHCSISQSGSGVGDPQMSMDSPAVAAPY